MGFFGNMASKVGGYFKKEEEPVQARAGYQRNESGVAESPVSTPVEPASTPAVEGGSLEVIDSPKTTTRQTEMAYDQPMQYQKTTMSNIRPKQNELAASRIGKFLRNNKDNSVAQNDSQIQDEIAAYNAKSKKHGYMQMLDRKSRKDEFGNKIDSSKDNILREASKGMQDRELEKQFNERDNKRQLQAQVARAKGPGTGAIVGAKLGAALGFTRTGLVGKEELKYKRDRRESTVKAYGSAIDQLTSERNRKMKKYNEDGKITPKESADLNNIMKQIDGYSEKRSKHVDALTRLDTEKMIDDKFRYADKATVKQLRFDNNVTRSERRRKGAKGKQLSALETGSGQAIFGILNAKGPKSNFPKKFEKMLGDLDAVTNTSGPGYLNTNPMQGFIGASNVPMYPGQPIGESTQTPSEIAEDVGEPGLPGQPVKPRSTKNNVYNVDDWILNA